MAWFAREFIAVPDDRKRQLVYKWPDVTIRRYSRAIVNADELALFVRSGQVLATLGPGRHRIDAVELPVLGALLDTVSGGNLYRAELYFVAGRELTGLRFGGRLADVRDPVSEQVVTLRAFGEFALAVRDPAVLVTALTGTADLADPGAVTAWAADLLLKSMKVAVAGGVARGEWPVLGLSERLGPIEAAVVRETNLALYEYGLRIPRLGNFDITLAPEDAERLKRLAKDITYIRLAGDFQRYAAGELALGAGQGLAHGGGSGAEGGLLGAALGLAALQQPRGVLPAERGPAPACGGCGATSTAGARFCAACGAGLVAPPRHCSGCGAEAAPGARFCTACGIGLTG